MKKATLTGLSLICLLVLGACTAPATTDGKPGVKAEQQMESRKIERAERNFFDRGGSFK